MCAPGAASTTPHVSIVGTEVGIPNRTVRLDPTRTSVIHRAVGLRVPQRELLGGQILGERLEAGAHRRDVVGIGRRADKGADRVIGHRQQVAESGLGLIKIVGRERNLGFHIGNELRCQRIRNARGVDRRRWCSGLNRRVTSCAGREGNDARETDRDDWTP